MRRLLQRKPRQAKGIEEILAKAPLWSSEQREKFSRNKGRRFTVNVSAMKMLSLVALSAAIAFSTSLAYAATPTWTNWERANSVAKHGQWLVIRQPNDGFCYIRQSYDRYSNEMDLSMKKDGVPWLSTPFWRGIQGDVSYRVDDGPVRIVPEKEGASGIELSSDVVPELKRGRRLTVRVKPVGSRTLEQTFDLRGFAAASELLGSPKCQKKVPDQQR